MRIFFIMVFGGLVAVTCGVGLAYGGSVIWRSVSGNLSVASGFSLATVTSAVMPKPTDGTSISGLVRKVRYTAGEEEDARGIIDAAASSLPQGADGKITASAFLVSNLERGSVSAEYNKDKLLSIASLSKLVTAVVARKLISDDERIVLSKEIISTYGNTAGFRVQETFSAGDLLYPLLMVSSNDAAEALARDYGRKKFILAMNDFVQSIGAYRTYFTDPSGLSAANISTANDLALVLDWIRKNDPYILEVTKMKSKTVRSHTWVNPTHFLSWSYYAGGKNGYTPEADRTSASLFELGSSKDIYAVVVLGSDSRDTDVIKLLKKVK